MKQAIAKLESISPYSQSKHYELPKLAKELADAYERRTWRERCHVDKEGGIFIPPMAFRNCVAEAAKFLSISIPGKGKQTWTKHFESGLLVTEGVSLPIKKDKVDGEWLFVPADGRRGGGKRVKKCFPLIPEWKGEVTYYVVDDTITQDVFLKHLKEAGQLIGIGRFRPRNLGYYGRFKVLDIQWVEMEE